MRVGNGPGRNTQELTMDIHIKKADSTITVDEAKFPDHVRAHLFEYGVRQKLNDAISQYSSNGSASTTKATPDEMLAVVTSTLDRLYAGDTRATRSVDTVGRMALGLAVRKVCNVWLASNKGKELKAYTSRNADAAAYLATHPELTALAEQMAELTSGEAV